MILATMLAGTGFVYSIHKDPFTDDVTHIAELGNPNRVYLSVECGSLTGWAMAVRIVPGRLLYRGGGVGGVYTDRFRFGEQPPIELRVSYMGDMAALHEESARTFIEGLETSEHVVFELTDVRADEFTLSFSTKGATDSIARVRKACSAPKVK